MKRHSMLTKISSFIFIYFFTTFNIAFAETKLQWFAELCEEKKSLIEVTVDCSKIPSNAVIDEAIFEIAFFDNQNKLIGKELFSFLDEKKLSRLQSPDCYLRYFKHNFHSAYTAKGEFFQASNRVYGTLYSVSNFNIPIRYQPKPHKTKNTANIKTIDIEQAANPQGKKQMVINSSVKKVPIQTGKSVLINIAVRGLDGKPIIGAVVEVSAGGGKFLRSSDDSTVGYTNNDGIFIARWACAQCCPGYGFGIKVIKPDYIQSSSERIIRF